MRSNLETHKNRAHLCCLLYEATSNISTFPTENGMLVKAYSQR